MPCIILWQRILEICKKNSLTPNQCRCCTPMCPSKSHKSVRVFLVCIFGEWHHSMCCEVASYSVRGEICPKKIEKSAQNFGNLGKPCDAKPMCPNRPHKSARMFLVCIFGESHHFMCREVVSYSEATSVKSTSRTEQSILEICENWFDTEPMPPLYVYVSR